MSSVKSHAARGMRSTSPSRDETPALHEPLDRAQALRRPRVDVEIGARVPEIDALGEPAGRA